MLGRLNGMENHEEKGLRWLSGGIVRQFKRNWLMYANLKINGMEKVLCFLGNLKQTGCFWRTLGTCGFHCWDKSTGCCDVGYDLLPDFWGQGAMLEAMRVIIDFARSDMKLKSINACIYADNKKSINLAEKCGFTFEGKVKDEVFRREKYPHKIFSLRVRTHTAWCTLIIANGWLFR